MVQRALLANTKLGPLVKGLSPGDLQQIAANAWRLEVEKGQEAGRQVKRFGFKGLHGR